MDIEKDFHQIIAWLKLHTDRKRTFHWMLITVMLSILTIVARPAALNAVDYWNNCHLTEQDRLESMGLSFRVSRPPVGRGQMLNRDQLRWILMMEMRMDEMKPLIHHDNEEAVRAFTEMVEDFNSRAASYQCEVTDYNGAVQDVKEHSASIKERAVQDVKEMGWDKPKY